MFSALLSSMEGSPQFGALALVAFVGSTPLRHLLLFIGFNRALHRAHDDASRVSLFAAFSAALTPNSKHRTRQESQDEQRQ
ncbi:hypothetical protein ACWD5F_34915 [Streptomyces sp. NPDC002499]